MITPEFLPGLMSSAAATDIDTARVGLIYRPTVDGSNEAHAAAIQRRLHASGSDVLLHPSEPDIAGNQEVLQQLWVELSPTVIGMMGGDGTASNTLSALQQSQLQLPAWLVKAGRINDLHHQVYGSYNYRHPEHALHKGRFSNAHPIGLTLQEPNGTVRERSAWVYASFNASAEVGAIADSPQHRKRRDGHRTSLGKFAVDARMALSTLAAAQPLIVIENGSERRALDVVLPKGRQMAGKLRFQNIDLFRPEFGRVELSRTGLLELAKTAGKAALHGVERLTYPENLQFELRSASGEPIHFQHDGETELIESGTVVVAALEKRGVHIHTTRRRR